MDLKDFGRALRRYWMTVAVCAFLGLVLASSASLLMKPMYTGHTQLFVAIQSTGSVAELQQGNTFTQARVQSYVQTAKTPIVLQPVIENLGLDLAPGELAEKVTARADTNTVLITIAAVDASPVKAAAIAQAVADSLIEVVEELESPASGGASPIKLSVVTPATAPSEPSSTDIRLSLAIGLLSGLSIGVALALTRSALDTRIRGEEDLTQLTDSPLLGGIAYDSDAAKKPLLTQATHQSPRAESFRQIRTNLQFANVNNNTKTILVTSSLPGEGKTTTATNIAIALAQAGQRVVLVDADLRRPMVATYLGLEGSAGLTTALVGSADVEDLLQPWGDEELYVLTSGLVPPNPSELLGSATMASLLDRLETIFDAVIVDAPPLIPVTDGSVLAQRVGGVVVVAGVGKIRKQHLNNSLQSLAMVKGNLLGIVLNLLPTKGPDAYTYSYYSYDSKPEPRKSPEERVAGRGSAERSAGSRRARTLPS